MVATTTPRLPMIYLAALLTAVDAGATALWLRLGIATEANPWLHHLVTTWGANQAMLTRAGVGLLLLLALARLARQSLVAPYGLAVVTGVLGGVCIWHGLGVALIATRAVI
jgi:hypothetical protein